MLKSIFLWFIFSDVHIQSIPETEPDPHLTLFYAIRFLIFTVRITLLFLGSINIFVIVQVLLRPYFRSISNVYLISLCAANIVYLLNLMLIIATRLFKVSFNEYTCMMITASEKIGKKHDTKMPEKLSTFNRRIFID